MQHLDAQTAMEQGTWTASLLSFVGLSACSCCSVMSERTGAKGFSTSTFVLPDRGGFPERVPGSPRRERRNFTVNVFGSVTGKGTSLLQTVGQNVVFGRLG